MEIENVTPRQVYLDVRFSDGGETTQMPQIVLLAGQAGNLFVGERDASGGETGVVVDAVVVDETATLHVTKRERGEIVDSQRLTVPVER